MGICKLYVNLLKNKNIRPIVVFDGLPLPGKEKERARSRQLLYIYKSKICVFVVLFETTRIRALFTWLRLTEANRHKAKCMQQLGRINEANKI